LHLLGSEVGNIFKYRISCLPPTQYTKLVNLQGCSYKVVPCHQPFTVNYHIQKEEQYISTPILQTSLVINTKTKNPKIQCFTCTTATRTENAINIPVSLWVYILKYDTVQVKMQAYVDNVHYTKQ
jgi:hypothetical protein